MKVNIHPKWYSEATVTCGTCGTTWKTGASTPTIRTDICSNCHPFYTGEQRIVDTEGQVDRFLKRLQVRDARRSEIETRTAAKTPLTLSVSDLGIEKRYTKILSDNGVGTVGDFIQKLTEGGDEAVLAIPGIGRKVVSDIKKALRNRGYELPSADAE